MSNIIFTLFIYLLLPKTTIVLPFIYDDINKAEDGYFVCKYERWGTVDLDGKVIVDTKYRIVGIENDTTKINNNKFIPFETY